MTQLRILGRKSAREGTPLADYAEGDVVEVLLIRKGEPLTTDLGTHPAGDDVYSWYGKGHRRDVRVRRSLFRNHFEVVEE